MDEQYSKIMQSALSENTRLAYQKGWQRFEQFCHYKFLKALPAAPSTVIDFLITHATQPVGRNGNPLSMGTVSLYSSAINHKHIHSGFASPGSHPEVIMALRGLMRVCGTKVRRVEALREHQVLKMLKLCPKTPIGIRDAALLAIIFAGALRRSEACGLCAEDIRIIKSRNSRTPSGMFIYIRKSKTDQEGRGQKIAIPPGKRIKPIQRVCEWLRVSGIKSGYLFQTMKRGGGLRGNPLHHSDIPRLVKHYGKLIGLDPKNIAGHSLRAGFVTSAAAHNARLDKIMEVTRHTNPTTVLKYIRDADAFTQHAGDDFL
ncbi:site-specific integrase [Thioalkalivibrio sp. HK1]|uniref:site-specific integrase n=1 Tax=Thioalkalivibrio sp. HK1 TaxID=1469245 RepID=UPI000472FC2E|nr:site-specific integrase [Thioalkalivibrio sp. HK1]